MSLNIAISAGEASGDLNAAYLAAEIKKLRNDVQIWGAGGPRMQEAGVDIVVNMTGGGTIGVSETLKALPGIAVKYFRLRGELLRRKPDLFVPVDYGAFNIRLAQIARKNGIPVVYYFPPSSWRRKPKNAAKLIACGGKVITPFPWSREMLAAAGVDAEFVGHPLVDIVKPNCSRTEFFKELGLSESVPLIGLMPGSRSHEIKEHLMPMLKCAEIMHRELGGAQFVIGAAGQADVMRERIKEVSNSKSNFPAIHVLERRSYDCMAHSDFLISKSGTATLEAAILGTPMIIIYRGSAIMRFEFIFRKAVLEDYIGLPNIIANKGVCPELINDDVTGEKLADVALGIMRDATQLAKMKASLAEVRGQLGGNGAVERAARTLLYMGGLNSQDGLFSL